MELELSGGGRVMFGAPQQYWHGNNPTVMQTSRFAGQEMMAITDDAGAFQLLYLGFQTGSFTTIEDAKKSAPALARKVLSRLSEMIAD